MNWSDHQLRIFDFVEHSEGHLLIEAVAGSGKSTTLKEIVRRIPPDKSILVLAFNRHIKAPLDADLSDLYNVKVATLNGFGFSAVRRALSHVTVNADKTANVLRYSVLEGADTEGQRAIYYSTVKVISKITGLRKSLMLWELALPDLYALCDTYDISLPSSCSELELLHLCKAIYILPFPVV